MSNENELTPFFNQDPSAGGPEVEPQTQEEIDSILENYILQGYTPQEIVNVSSAHGHNMDMLQRSMYVKKEEQKTANKIQRETDLKALSEQRQLIIDAEVRKEAREEEGDSGALFNADNKFLNSQQAYNFIEKSINDLDNQEDVNNQDLVSIEYLLHHNYGVTTPLMQARQESWDAKKSIIAPDWGFGAGQYIVDAAAADAWGGTAKRTPEQLTDIRAGLETLRTQTDVRLAESLADHNALNTALGYPTDFEPDSNEDVRLMNFEINARLGLAEELEQGQEWYGNSFGYVDTIGGVVNLPTSELVAHAGSWAWKSLVDIGAIVNGATFNSVQYKRWTGRRNAELAGFNDAIATNLGVTERNKSRDASAVGYDFILDPTGDNAFQVYAKSTDFLLSMIPEVAAAIYTLGGAPVAKKTATKIGLKMFTKQNLYLTSLGLKSSGAFYQHLDENRQDLTRAEKLNMSFFVGLSEVFLARMFKGMEKQAHAIISKPITTTKQLAADNLKKAVGSIDNLGPKGSLLKATLGESLEEGLQSVISEYIEGTYELVNGRTTNFEPNFFAIADGFIGGAIMGSGMSAVGRYSSNLGHSKVMKSVEAQLKVVESLRESVDSTQDPVERKRLRAKLMEQEDRLRKLHSIGNSYYDRHTEEDQKIILGLNQKLSHLKQQINSARGKHKDELTEQFKKLWLQKAAIESSVITEAEMLEQNNGNSGIEELFKLAFETVAASNNPDTSTHEAMPIEQAESFNDEDVTGEIYRLLELAQDARSKAKADPKNAQKWIEQHGKYQSQARRIAQNAGLEGSSWVDVLDSWEKGKKVVPSYDFGAARNKPAVKSSGDVTATDESFEDLKLGLEGDVMTINDTDTPKVAHMKRAVNNLNQAFGKIIKESRGSLRVYKTVEGYYNSTKKLRERSLAIDLSKGGQSYGVMIPNADGSWAIHLNPEAENVDVFEEFGHAVLLPIIRTDGENRNRLFKEVLTIAGMEMVEGNPTPIKGKDKFNKAARKIVQERIENYDSSAVAEFEEEVIMGFLVQYVTAPGLFNSTTDKKGIRAILKWIHSAYRKAIKRGAIEAGSISFDDSLLKIAESFRQAAFIGKETSVVAKGSHRMPDGTIMKGAEHKEDIDDSERLSTRSNKPFTYLNNTEIFFTEIIYSGGDLAREQRVVAKNTKSVKVNDFWHFSNWYAQVTGNGQSSSRAIEMYFIKDGVRKAVNPPKPKLNQDGTWKFMPPPPTLTQLGVRKRIKTAKEDLELTVELNKQFSAIMEEGFEVLRTIEGMPVGINVLSFVPEGSPAESYGREADIEGVTIALANIKAMKASGVTFNDPSVKRNKWGYISKEINPGLFNMSGAVRQEEGTIDGEPTITGRMSFRSTKGGTAKGIALTLEEMAELKADYSNIVFGDIEDHNGVQILTAGYDATRPEGADETGVMSARKEGYVVSHSTREKGFEGRSALLSLMNNDALGEKKGYVLMGFTTQDKRYIKGNPKVFKETIEEFLRQPESMHEDIVAAFNSFFLHRKGDTKSITTLKKKILREVYMSELIEESGSNAFQNRLLSETSQAASEGGTPGSLQVETMEELRLALAVISSMKSVNMLEYSDESDLTFRFRQSFLEKLLNTTAIKNLKKPDGNPVRSPLDAKASYLEESWGKAYKGSLVAIKKIPYSLNNDGSIDINSVPKLSKDSSAAFGWKITSEEALSEPLVILKNQYKLEDMLTNVKAGKSAQTAMAGAKGEVSAEAATRGTEMKLTEKKTAPEGRESFRQTRNNLPEGVTDWHLNEQSSMDAAIENFQKKIVDKYKGILNLQTQIERQKGSVLSQAQDFKAAEELMYGKAANDLENLDAAVSRLVEVMEAENVTEADLSRYLYALHARERNAIIIERGGKEDGSGMSNAEADRIINELSNNQGGLEKSAEIVRKMIKNTRATYASLGLHTKADIKAWEDMFENYVPLSGLAKDEENDISSSYPTGGKGLSVTSSMVKRAQGRGSSAENIVAQVIAQNAAAHIKGRTNEAVRSLYEMISNNKNDAVWKILNVADRDNPNVIGVRVDGKQKYIWFADASYAETLRGMNLPQTNIVIKMLRAPANWLRRSFTTLNPEFVISNFSRDIQAAIFNAAAEAEIEGGAINGEGVIKDILKNVGPSLKSLLKDAFHKDMDPTHRQYFEDFKEDGGKTGWAYAKDLSEIAKDLQTETGKKNAAQKVWGGVKNFADHIEGINDAFENSIRLSSYIAARENGVSRQKAAQFAKNITVNFNKHGEWGQTLNAVYLFFNASVQGTSRLFRSLATGKPAVRPDGSTRAWYQRANNSQKLAAGFAVFNGLLTVLNQALSDEDEDGTLFYDKIPDYVKERNLIVMYDGKNYFTIPMPYGFSVFANIGSVSAEVASGSREIDEAMFFLANSFVSSFSPISFGQSEDLGKYALKAITPTVLKPLVDIAVNETHFGTPVHAENLPFGAPKPNSSMSFRSPDAVKQMFKWLNQVTDGTVHRAGDVDINPDSLWYLFQYFVGGAGQFITRSGETTFKLAHKLTDTPDLKLSYNDIPLLRKMYGEPSKYYDYGLYSERSNEIKTLMRELKDPTTRRSADNYEGVMYLDKLINKVNKMLKVIRAKKRDAKDIADYPTRAVTIQNLQDQERKLVMEFNKLYDVRRKQK